MSENEEYKDIVIVVAGLSGIGAACHLKRECPNKNFIILEARASIGGTWDLFKYPGIRSDSDMFTLGYKFKPWRSGKAIADGPSILKYIKETAEENKIVESIRFNKTLVEANWDSLNKTWKLKLRDTLSKTYSYIQCNFLYMCSGYYNYEKPYCPDFLGAKNFKGTIIHPQLWKESTNYTNKFVTVIGSGATAVTLVPELAKKARKVVMLQRSPTYLIARPSEDWFANLMRVVFSSRLAYAITRFRNILFQEYIYKKSRRHPTKLKNKLLREVRKEVGNSINVDQHLTPKYNPWDQRLCLIPDGNLYDVLKNKKAEIVTDEIIEFNEFGIRLKSGRQLDSDIIITATGLNLQTMGGATVKIHSEEVDLSKCWTYKGIMISDIPNMVSTFGYINASWTLRADLISEWVCKLINFMDQERSKSVTPIASDTINWPEPKDWIDDFSSGYMKRAMKNFPKQSKSQPWINSQDYRLEKKLFNQALKNDKALIFH